MTEDPIVGPYLRGRLQLAGVDLSAPLRAWLDAVYAAWAEAPGELLPKLAKHVTVQAAMLRPEEARETWGLLPEHRALGGNLVREPGLEAGRGRAPAMERKADVIDRWSKARGVKPPRRTP